MLISLQLTILIFFVSETILYNQNKMERVLLSPAQSEYKYNAAPS
jgi:hypothetical protein